MQFVRKLPLTMPVGERESPVDYLSRLAFRNGRDSTRFLCSDFGLRYNDVLKGGPRATEAIAALGDADASALARESFDATETARRVAHKGEILAHLDVNRLRLRVCVSCVEQDLDAWTFRPEARMSRRSEWCLTSIRTCAHHRESLVDTGEEERFQDASRSFARALPRLREIKGMSAERQPSSFELYVLSRLAGNASPNWLDRLPFFAAIRLCGHIGNLAAGDGRGVRSHRTDQERWAYNDMGYGILSQGAVGIVDFLERLRRPPNKGKREVGLPTILGDTYSTIEGANVDGAYEPFCEVARQYVFDTMPIGPDKKIFGKAPPQRKVHSLGSLADGLDIKRTKVRKILAVSGIVPAASSGVTPHRLTFDSASVSSVIKDFSETLNLRQAVERLGLTPSCRTAAGSHWFPKPLFGTENIKELGYNFRPRDLDEFVSEVFALAKPELVDAPGLVDLKRAQAATFVAVADIIGMVVDRQLARVGRRSGGRALEALLVDSDEIRSIIRRRNGGRLTRALAAKSLGVTRGTLNALLRIGAFQSEVGRGQLKDGLTLLRSEDVEAFRRDYVGFGPLSRELGIGYVRLAPLLADLGVHVAFPHDEIGVRIYRRSDIEAVRHSEAIASARRFERSNELR